MAAGAAAAAGLLRRAGFSCASPRRHALSPLAAPFGGHAVAIDLGVGAGGARADQRGLLVRQLRLRCRRPAVPREVMSSVVVCFRRCSAGPGLASPCAAQGRQEGPPNAEKNSADRGPAPASGPACASDTSPVILPNAEAASKARSGREHQPSPFGLQPKPKAAPPPPPTAAPPAEVKHGGDQGGGKEAELSPTRVVPPGQSSKGYGTRSSMDNGRQLKSSFARDPKAFSAEPTVGSEAVERVLAELRPGRRNGRSLDVIMDENDSWLGFTGRRGVMEGLQRRHDWRGTLEVQILTRHIAARAMRM